MADFKNPADPMASPFAPPAPAGPDGNLPSEEELDRLVELGLIDAQMAENLRQRIREEGLSDAPAPEGREVGGMFGRTFVAANPLEHVAGLGSKASALYRRAKLGKEQEGLLDKRRLGRKTGYEMWLAAQEDDESAPFGM